MKRLTPKIKLHQMRIAANRARRKRKLKLRQRKWSQRCANDTRLRVFAPEQFNLEREEPRAELIQFLADLRGMYLNNSGRTLVIDFSRTHRFIANGALLFYAELCRLIEYGNGKISLRCKPPMNRMASEVLEQIGVYRLCNHESHGKPSSEEVIHWKVLQGSHVNNSLAGPAIEAFDKQIGTETVDSLLGGIGEAMTNAKHHAYLNVRDDGLNYPQRGDEWWMFFRVRDGHLSVVICDLGIGISNTLSVQRPLIWKALEALGLSKDDAACIKEAIKDSRSRTNLPGRGHGLGNIMDAVANTPNSVAAVFSNYGAYRLENDVVESKNFNTSILGTLIFWRLPLGVGTDGT